MDFVEQLKSSVDIVKTIQGYGVKLKRMGSTGRYLGLCPFHSEKTPSFNVNATMQRYKCFGCGVGGDVLNFVMELERISFFEALKLLAETNGIAMPKRTPSCAELCLRCTRLPRALFTPISKVRLVLKRETTWPAAASHRSR